jgi:SOS-response transcriptional repressor LexA
MQNARIIVADWLRRVIDSTGLKAAAWARQAGVSPSTVTRALDPDATSTLSTETIRKLAAAAGVPPPDLGSGQGFAESDAAPFQGTPATPRTNANAGTAIMQVTSRALEHLGMLPGDLIEVDLRAKPQRGDVVVAQIYDFNLGRAHTVLRRYIGPFLVAATSDERLMEPRMVDGNVGIKGVVRRLYRDVSRAA